MSHNRILARFLEGIIRDLVPPPGRKRRTKGPATYISNTTTRTETSGSDDNFIKTKHTIKKVTNYNGITTTTRTIIVYDKQTPKGRVVLSETKTDQ
jgi:hypothetical protein